MISWNVGWSVAEFITALHDSSSRGVTDNPSLYLKIDCVFLCCFYDSSDKEAEQILAAIHKAHIYSFSTVFSDFLPTRETQHHRFRHLCETLSGLAAQADHLSMGKDQFGAFKIAFPRLYYMIDCLVLKTGWAGRDNCHAKDLGPILASCPRDNIPTITCFIQSKADIPALQEAAPTLHGVLTCLVVQYDSSCVDFDAMWPNAHQDLERLFPTTQSIHIMDRMQLFNTVPRQSKGNPDSTSGDPTGDRYNKHNPQLPDLASLIRQKEDRITAQAFEIAKLREELADERRDKAVLERSLAVEQTAHASTKQAVSDKREAQSEQEQVRIAQAESQRHELLKAQQDLVDERTALEQALDIERRERVKAEEEREACDRLFHIELKTRAESDHAQAVKHRQELNSQREALAKSHQALADEKQARAELEQDIECERQLLTTTQQSLADEQQANVTLKHALAKYKKALKLEKALETERQIKTATKQSLTDVHLGRETSERALADESSECSLEDQQQNQTRMGPMHARTFQANETEQRGRGNAEETHAKKRKVRSESEQVQLKTASASAKLMRRKLANDSPDSSSGLSLSDSDPMHLATTFADNPPSHQSSANNKSKKAFNYARPSRPQIQYDPPMQRSRTVQSKTKDGIDNDYDNFKIEYGDSSDIDSDASIGVAPHRSGLPQSKSFNTPFRRDKTHQPGFGLIDEYARVFCRKYGINIATMKGRAKLYSEDFLKKLVVACTKAHGHVSHPTIDGKRFKADKFYLDDTAPMVWCTVMAVPTANQF
jgi:hypothetical protein